MKETQELSKFHKINILTSFMIVFCSIVLGIETYFHEKNAVFTFLDYFFALYFLIEIFVRFWNYSPKLEFFKLYEIRSNEQNKNEIVFREEGFWNWFDLVIVIISSVSLLESFFEHPEFLMVSRLFRVFRILRLLEVSKELKEVETKIISIIPTIFSFALLLGVLMYIYAIVGVNLFAHQKYNNADFSNLQNSLLTLFQCITLEGWVDIMHQASEHNHHSWFVKGYFISFIILTVIVSFNVFVAVLTSQVQEKISASQQKEEEKLMELLNQKMDAQNQIHIEHYEKLKKELEELKRLICSK
jgi:voltage-gated sodium channel